MFGEILSAILFFIVFVTIYVECWKVYLNWTKLRAFHHVRGWPVIGKALDSIGKNNEEFFRSFVTKSENLSYAWVGPVRVFHVARPEEFQAILTSDKCLKKSFLYDFLHCPSGLLTAKPSVWKEHRRALSPTLGPKMVNSFLPIFNEKFKKMANLMQRQIDSYVDLHNIIFRATMDTIVSTSFGVNWTMQNRRGDEIQRLIVSANDDIQRRIQRVWLWSPAYKLTQTYEAEKSKREALYRFDESALENKRMHLAERLEHGDDELAIAKENNNQNFLQKCLQLEREQKWTDLDIRDEMVTILIAGVDTSSTIFYAITLMLAIHPEYQERVVDEMHEIFEDANEPVTNAHISRMTFLELVIKESMRLFPIVPFIGRECTSDLEINGGIIPKGSQIFLDVLRMHKNPKFFGKNAHEFYPERFLPENRADWHPYLFVPFSMGARNCIGTRYAWASLKISLSHVLRRFKLTTHLKLHEVIIIPNLLLKIGNKNAIRIEHRKW